MLKGDWIKPLAFGLVILAFLFVWAAYHVGSQIGETRGEKNYHTGSYERHASDKIRNTCLSGQGGDIAECISEVIKATNEDQRAQHDLVAQTEMATWAFWMFVSTIVMTGITSIGVVFVWLTLKETAAGVQAMRIEQRPWLRLDIDDYCRLELTVGKYLSVSFNAAVKNVGKSVAVGVDLQTMIEFRGENWETVHKSDWVSSGTVDGVVFPEETIGGKTSAFDRRHDIRSDVFPLAMLVHIRAQYRDAHISTPTAPYETAVSRLIYVAGNTWIFDDTFEDANSAGDMIWVDASLAKDHDSEDKVT